jgi:hypothetical protein
MDHFDCRAAVVSHFNADPDPYFKADPDSSRPQRMQSVVYRS